MLSKRRLRLVKDHHSRSLRRIDRSTEVGASRTSLLWNEHGSAIVLDQKDEELGRLRIARVPPDGVDIVGTLVERLPRCQGHFWSTLDLHHDGPLQYVDEAVRIVPMHRIRAARRVLDRNQQTLFTGDVRKRFRDQ